MAEQPAPDDYMPIGPYLYTEGNAYAVEIDHKTGWGTLMVAPLFIDNAIDHTQWAEFEPANIIDHRLRTGMIVTLIAMRDSVNEG